MKLEVFAYYPNPEPKITPKGTEVLGTLHLYIADFSLDLRFILVTKTKHGGYKCFLPHRKAECDGRVVKVPYVDFTDFKMRAKIMRFCDKYIKNYYKPKES